MDFFARQEYALASSRKLILLFLIALPCVIAAVYVASVFVYFGGWAFIAFLGSVFAGVDFKFMTLADCTLNAIDISLNNLAEAAPRLKKLFLEACVETVAADGVIRRREAEMLRAIADTLDCPIPPFMPEAK